MPPPSLLIKGYLKGENQEKLNKYVPIDYCMEWFKQRMNLTGVKNRLLVLKAETASGKSTAFPSTLYLTYIHGIESKRGLICTQPRILTAKRNVFSILDVPNYAGKLKLGVNIGWSTGSNKLTVGANGFISAVLQTLMAQLMTMTDDEICQKYKFIMIDEVHERSIPLDQTLFLLKKFLIRNANNDMCPFVILSSATIAQKKYLDYFNCDETSFIYVVGNPFGRTEVWDLKKPVKNFIFAACDTVEKILSKGEDDQVEKGDILIFMPGLGEIERTINCLKTLNEKRCLAGLSVFNTIALDSAAVSSENFQYKLIDIPLKIQKVNINGKNYTPTRRIIVSTSTAETGVTFDALKYVIDAGYHKGIEYNPIINASILLTKPASVSRITQRMGRCGRKFAGIFYPLYPRDIFDKLQVQQYPEILYDNMSSCFLTLVNEQLKTKEPSNQKFSLEEMDLMDMPSPDMMQYCIEKSFMLGFFNIKTMNLTSLGKLCSKINIPMEPLRMIMAGWNWGYSIMDLASVACYISESEKKYIVNTKLPIDWTEIYKYGLLSYFASDDTEAYIYRIRLLICDNFLDGCILVNAIGNKLVEIEKKYPNEQCSKIKEWLAKLNLNYDAISSLLENRDKLISDLIICELNVKQNEEYSITRATKENLQMIIKRAKHCIAEGYKLNSVDYSDGIYSVKGFAIKTPDLFADIKENKTNLLLNNIKSDFRPKKILYSKIDSGVSQKTGMYKLKLSHFSIMDGYVPI